MTRELVVRAVDQGDTYLTWRWLDQPQDVRYSVIAAGALADMLARLHEALPQRLNRESAPAAIRRALIDGAFSSPDTELSLAHSMSEVLLTSDLADQLAMSTGPPFIRLHVIPSRRIARLPWELLVLPDGRRLLQVADVIHDVPAVVHVKRGRLPRDWEEAAHQPVLYVLDPRSQYLPTVLTDDADDALAAWLDQKYGEGRILHEDLAAALSTDVTSRTWLGDHLRGHTYSRLFYYGHASAVDGEPGSAAIHLADRANDVYGLACAVAGHRPFTALDILLGTLASGSDGLPAGAPMPSRLPGCQIWPMPPRIAIVACDSGGDYQYHEPFGLVISCLNAGAALISATRWTLPTDQAFRSVQSSKTCGLGPTTELAINIDRCHEGADPVRLLSDWQRSKLQAWTDVGLLSDTPLIWASITTHLAPGRSMVP